MGNERSNNDDKPSLEELLSNAMNIAKSKKNEKKTETSELEQLRIERMQAFAQKYALMSVCGDGMKCPMGGCTPGCARGKN